MALITEDYVSFETAKLLKDKGFNEDCHAYWDLTTETKTPKIGLSVSSKNWNYKWNPIPFPISAPTLQMAMKWLRKEHYCHIIIDYTFTADANLSEEYVSYCYKVENAKTYIQHTQDEWYNTFEKACEAAIKYCLENLI